MCVYMYVCLTFYDVHVWQQKSDGKFTGLKLLSLSLDPLQSKHGFQIKFEMYTKRYCQPGPLVHTSVSIQLSEKIVKTNAVPCFLNLLHLCCHSFSILLQIFADITTEDSTHVGSSLMAYVHTSSRGYAMALQQSRTSRQ